MKKKNQTNIFLPLVNNFIYLSLAVKTRSISYKFSLFAFFHDIEITRLFALNVFKMLIFEFSS